MTSNLLQFFQRAVKSATLPNSFSKIVIAVWKPDKYEKGSKPISYRYKNSKENTSSLNSTVYTGKYDHECIDEGDLILKQDLWSLQETDHLVYTSCVCTLSCSCNIPGMLSLRQRLAGHWSKAHLSLRPALSTLLKITSPPLPLCHTSIARPLHPASFFPIAHGT